MYRIPWDRLVRSLWWKRLTPGQRLESEEAAVCGFTLETFPICQTLSERILSSGEFIISFSNFTQLSEPVPNPHLLLPDCPSSCVRVHCPRLQSNCTTFWKVPKPGAGAQHVWGAVHLHQVNTWSLSYRPKVHEMNQSHTEFLCFSSVTMGQKMCTLTSYLECYQTDRPAEGSVQTMGLLGEWNQNKSRTVGTLVCLWTRSYLYTGFVW